MEFKLRTSGSAKDLDLDAKLFQLLGPVGEAFRVKHVRRQIDQCAGDIDTLGQTLDAIHGGGQRGGVSGAEPHIDDAIGLGLVLLAFLGLVDVEFISAQAQAERQIGGGLGGFFRRRREIEQDAQAFGLAGLGDGQAADAQVIDGFAFFFRRSADDDEFLRGQADRGQQFEARADLALESGDLGGARQLRGAFPERLRGGGSEPDAAIGENHERIAALFRLARQSLLKSNDTDGDGPGHKYLLMDSAAARTKATVSLSLSPFEAQD